MEGKILKRKGARIGAALLLMLVGYFGFMSYRYFHLDSRTYQACMHHLGSSESVGKKDPQHYCRCISDNYARFTRYRDFVLSPLLPERAKEMRTRAMLLSTDNCRSPGDPVN